MKTHYYDFFPGLTCSLSWIMFERFLKNVYCAVVGYNILLMTAWCNSSISLSSFCFIYYWSWLSEVSYYHCVTIYFFLESCQCVLHIFRSFCICCINTCNYYIFLVIGHFIIIWYPSLSPEILLDLKSILSDISMVTVSLFWLPIAFKFFLYIHFIVASKVSFLCTAHIQILGF